MPVDADAAVGHRDEIGFLPVKGFGGDGQAEKGRLFEAGFYVFQAFFI